MSITQYHSIPPKDQATSHDANKPIEFQLNFANREFIMGSFDVETEVEAFSASGVSMGTKKVQLDGKIGCHGLFSDWQVISQYEGEIETLDEYPRFCRMMADANLAPSDLISSKYLCELRAPTDDLQAILMRKRYPRDYGGDANNGDITAIDASIQTNPDAVIKPLICLNRPLVEGQPLPFRQTGVITVRGNLSKALQALYGPECTATATFKLHNTRANFISRPDSGEPLKPIQFRSYSMISEDVISSQTNISSTVPDVCDSVAISYIETAKRYDEEYNDTQLDRPTNVNSIQFKFNGSLTSPISYEVKTQEEMVYRGLQALNGNKNNDLQLQNIYANDSVLHGLAFHQAIDMSNTAFNIQLNSGVVSSKPYTMFCFFNSIKVIG